MYELDDISTGFHDILLNKYNMSNTPMSDLYITDSMQDMLDIDIKSEVATVVGGPNEFVSLMRFAELPPLDLDSNSVDGDSFFRGGLTTTPPSDIYADMGTCANPNYVMPVSASSISLSSASDDGSLLSSSSMNALVAAQSLLKSPKQTQTINLNMAVRDTGRDPTLPSPKERKSHLTFSPSTLKVPMMLMQEAKKVSNQTQITRLNATNGASEVCGEDSQMRMVTNRMSSPVDSVRKDLSMQMMLKEEKIVVRTGMAAIKSEYQQQNGHGGGGDKRHNSSSSAASNTGVTGLGVGLGKGNTIKLAAGIGGLTFGNSMQFKTLKNVQKISALGTVGALKRSASPQMHGNRNGPASPKMFNQSVNGAQHQGAIGAGKPMAGTGVSNGMSSPNSPMVPAKTKHKGAHALGIESEFPKPAYSYSCLIAMALKNSRSGSLPVSEIYSFMCLHFPYFKTAPSGWKNSVRHNLSLNKCFEKIEKPATNGGQRKGCLWAMNPAKINKMDDEVQKWSRKDPQAIRRAMVHPEHLESLERGEMKHGSVNHDDLDPEEDLESDGGPSDVDAEEEADEDVADPDDEHEEEEVDEEDEEEDDDDVVEIMPPPQPIIDVDAESFIINTPESLIDGDEETGESIDFDLEVPDFYDNINVDSKDGSLAVELTPQDLLTLEDEDESLYINQSQQQQQQTQQSQVVHRLHQQRPIIRQTQIISQNHRHQQQLQQQQEQQPAKRARLDVNYRISPNLKPMVSGNGGVVSVLANRQPMTMTMAASPTSGSPVTLQSTVTSKGITIINSNGTINSVAGSGTTTFSFQQQGFQRSAQVQLTAQQHQQLLQQQKQQQHQQSQSNHRRKMPMVTRLA